MNFKKIFEKTLNESNIEEVEDFLERLSNKNNYNKYIKINIGNRELDGSFVFIEFEKGLYSWYITNKKSDDETIEQSDDYYKNIKRCIDSLRYVLQ